MKRLAQPPDAAPKISPPEVNDDRIFARHWEELVTLASNESDHEKLSLLMHEILQLLAQRKSKFNAVRN